MRKRLRISLFVCLIAGACLAALVFWHSKLEPTYQGRRLSAWVNDYRIFSDGFGDKGSSQTNDAVDDILRVVGTNFIPTLARMLDAPDSPMDRLRVCYHNGLFKATPAYISPALARHERAMLAIRALGPVAAPLVPKLTEIYNRKETLDAEETAAWALGGIGPAASNAVPSLLKTLTNSTSSYEQYFTICALSEIHAQREKTLPVLIKFLKDPDPNIRKKSFMGLQNFGTEARPAVPALIESLKDPTERVRKQATNALKVIDPDALTQAGLR